MEDDFGVDMVGDYEQQFTNCEIQVVDISCNKSILVVDLERKFGTFGDFGGYTSNIILEGKWECEC